MIPVACFVRLPSGMAFLNIHTNKSTQEGSSQSWLHINQDENIVKISTVIVRADKLLLLYSNVYWQWSTMPIYSVLFSVRNNRTCTYIQILADDSVFHLLHMVLGLCEARSYF